MTTDTYCIAFAAPAYNTLTDARIGSTHTAVKPIGCLRTASMLVGDLNESLLAVEDPSPGHWVVLLNGEQVNTDTRRTAHVLHLRVVGEWMPVEVDPDPETFARSVARRERAGWTVRTCEHTFATDAEHTFTALLETCGIVQDRLAKHSRDDYADSVAA